MLLSLKPLNSLALPINYEKASCKERAVAREMYIEMQKNLCFFCKRPLNENPSEKVMRADIQENFFPSNFFLHPIHLHHSHINKMTLGAVHARCNAYLWQYLGE